MDQEDIQKAKPRDLRQLARFLGLSQEKEKEFTDEQIRLWIKYETKPQQSGWY
jgi:hypothetical protein